MAQAYKVTGPLVITKKADGADLYLYHDSLLPDGVSADEIKRLVAIGLIGKASGDEVADPPDPTAESN